MKIRFFSLILTGLLLFTLSSSTSAGETGLVVKELARTGKSWDGETLPAYPVGPPEIRILSITIPAGQKLPVHHHPVINAGVLLSGQLRVHTKDGKVLDLSAGEAIVEVVNTWHWGESIGDTPAHIIVFYAATADTAITVTQE
jgi:quercetin dioxygenase-like cupin family protein